MADDSGRYPHQGEASDVNIYFNKAYNNEEDNTMKKILAMVLAMMLVLSMSVAFAADTGVTSSTPIEIKFDKKYTVTTSDDEYVVTYPAETITFKVEKAANNTNPSDTMISIAPTTMASNPNEITINVPAYSVPGVYNYTVSEYAANSTVGETVVNNTQGVTYSGASFDVQVLVAYNDAHTQLVATASVTTTADTTSGKVDSITNTYTLGHLDVTKTISGNLASTADEFEVEVTFTAATGKVVRSDITYVDGTAVDTVSVSEMADGTETVTITLKAGETVKFYNIPAGVSYTVKEKDYTAGDKNVALQGYSAPTYNGTAAANGYNGDIAASETDTVTINNEKKTEIETGISLDNAPYMILMGLVVLAGAALIVKRASANR